MQIMNVKQFFIIIFEIVPRFKQRQNMLVSQRVLSSSLLYILMLKQQLAKISLAWLIIMPIQILFIMLMSLQFNINMNMGIVQNVQQSQFAQQNQLQITKILANIWNHINSHNAMLAFMAVWLFICLSLIAGFIIFIAIKRPINEFDNNVNFLYKIVSISAFLVLLLQLILFPLFYNLKQLVLPSALLLNSKIHFYILPVIIIGLLFIIIINYRIRVMSFQFVILFLITQQQSLAFSFSNSIMGLLSCGLVIRNDQNHPFLMFKGYNLRKSYHLVLIGFFIWKFVDNFKMGVFTDKIDTSQSVGYIYLAIYLLIFMVLSVSFFKQRTNKKLPLVNQLCQCIQNLQQNPEDNQSKIIGYNLISDYLKNSSKISLTCRYPSLGQFQLDKNLNTNVINLNEAKQGLQLRGIDKGISESGTSSDHSKKYCYASSPLEKNKQQKYNKSINVLQRIKLGTVNWKFDQFYHIIHMMINQQYQKQPTLQLGINMIKCRLMVKDKRLFQIIQLLRNLIIKYNDNTIGRRYQIFKIVFKIEQAYFKKYKSSSNNPIIHILREVDNLNSQFYNICCNTIQSLYLFWEAVTHYQITIQMDTAEDTNEQYTNRNIQFKSNQKLNSKSFVKINSSKNNQLVDAPLMSMPIPFKSQSIHSPSSLQVQISKNMQKLIMKIDQNLKKLEKLGIQTSKLTQANRERKVLDYIKFLVTYTFENDHQQMRDTKSDGFQQDYQVSNSRSYMEDSISSGRGNQQIIRSLGISQCTDYSQYLQSVDSKITQVSLKLSTQLGYKKLELIEQKLSFLMPKCYQNDIEETIINHNEAVYKIPYLIPLITSDNTVILKNIVAYLQLDNNYGYRILYHMLNSHINKDPVVIYNTTTNIIEYYNKQFIDTFKIDKQKLDAKIRNKNLNPDEIFIDIQLSDKNIQNKLSESGLQTEYNCRFYTSKIGIRKAVKIQNIRLSLVQRQKCYMYVKVLKGHRIKSMVNQMEDESVMKLSKEKSQGSFFNIMNFDNQKLPFGAVKQLIQGEDEQNEQMSNRQEKQQQIYCKIQNPFDSKISTKKLQLTKSTKPTLKFYAVLAIIIAMIMLVTQGFTFLYISESISSAIASITEFKLGQVSMYTQLMYAYQCYYQYKLIGFKQMQFQAIGVDWLELAEKTAKQLENQVQGFQKQYLRDLASDQQDTVQFYVKFKNYQIKTDTSRTNLFDFSQNLLRYKNDSESLEFLTKNYPQFSKLVTKTMNKQVKFQKQIDHFYLVYYSISGAIFLFSLLCLIISSLISIKIGYVRADIEYIFRLIKLVNLESMFRGLRSLRNCIIKINEEGIKEEKRCDQLVRYCLEASSVQKHDQKQQQQKEKRKKFISININQQDHQKQNDTIITNKNKKNNEGILKKKQINIPASLLSSLKNKQVQQLQIYHNSMNSPNSSNNNSNIFMLQSPKNQLETQRHVTIKAQAQADNESNTINSIQMKYQKQFQTPQKNVEQKQQISEDQQVKKTIHIQKLGICGYISVLAIILLTTLLQIFYLEKKVNDQYMITKFKVQDKKITQNIIHQILQASHYMLTVQALSQMIPNTAVSDPDSKYELFVNKLTVNNHKLPQDYFKAYEAKYYSKISSNICDFLALSSNKAHTFICNKLCNGMLAYGLRESIEGLSNFLLYSTNSKTWFTKSDSINISVFQQIIYTQQILIEVNGKAGQQLKTYEYEAYQQMNRKAMQIFILGCLLSFARFVITFIMKKYIYRASKVGIGYFLIMPKNVLLQYDVIDHLRKKDVLNRISTI